MLYTVDFPEVNSKYRVLANYSSKWRWKPVNPDSIHSRSSVSDACTMQLLISAMEVQTTQAEGACEVSPECSAQIIKGSGLAFQQTSRVRAAVLSKIFDCMDGVDLSAHIYKLCIQIYKEAKSLEAWDHPAGTQTLFMQQSKWHS